MDKEYVIEKLAMRLTATDNEILEQRNPFILAPITGLAVGNITHMLTNNPTMAIQLGLIGMLPGYYYVKHTNKLKIDDPEAYKKKVKESAIYKFLKKLE